MKRYLSLYFLLLAFLCSTITWAQNFKEGKFTLNETGSHYIKVTALTQVWVRSQQYNQGSTVFGYPKSGGLDIGIRRYRLQLMGQLTDRVFFYTQLGENNFNSISDRKLGFFVHDATVEYAVVQKHLSLGGGLSGWSGLSRFSSPSAGTIMGLDAPLFLQSTNDVTDQFLRKLSVYAKGKIGKVDYRLSMAKPMAFQKSSAYNAAISTTSNFSSKPSSLQWNGYVQYQFFDQESNLTPYNTGTYLGKKKVLNLGVGAVYQPKAMWHLASNGDTVDTKMLQLAADVFYDAPLGKKGSAISVYGNFSYFDFGHNYSRNLAVMNPTNGTTNTAILNGSGNGFPAYGTGYVGYAQVGYKFRDSLIGKTTIMPYVALQHASYERLEKPMDFFDVGVNWLLNAHTSKLTLAYQNRPIFNTTGDILNRKGAFVLQYQIFFN